MGTSSSGHVIDTYRVPHILIPETFAQSLSVDLFHF